VRAFAAYPLVPYSNRIADARLTFAGRTHELARNFGDHPHAIHGVGWQHPWSVLARGGRAVALELVHHAEGDSRRAWPWSFRATQTLELVAQGAGAAMLHATLTLESRANEPFPFGLGWHPYFPKPAGTRLRFHAASVWQNGPTELPTACVPVPEAWRFDAPRTLDSVVLDQVFNGWGGHAELHPPGAPAVTLRADRACGRLVVYAPAGRDFVCLEPVTHETNAFNRAAEGAVNTGMRVLGPGEAFSCTMRLAVANGETAALGPDRRAAGGPA
jgi:aldose 1-epimerase